MRDTWRPGARCLGTKSSSDAGLLGERAQLTPCALVYKVAMVETVMVVQTD